MNQHYPKLISCIEKSPSDVAVQLRPSGILSQADWVFLTSPHEVNEKAIKIVDAVVKQVQISPQPEAQQVFDAFVSALKAAGDWTKPLVTQLKDHIIHTRWLLANTNTEAPLGIVSHSLDCTSRSHASVNPPTVDSGSELDSHAVQSLHGSGTTESPRFGESMTLCRYMTWLRMINSTLLVDSHIKCKRLENQQWLCMSPSEDRGTR